MMGNIGEWPRSTGAVACRARSHAFVAELTDAIIPAGVAAPASQAQRVARRCVCAPALHERANFPQRSREASAIVNRDADAHVTQRVPNVVMQLHAAARRCVRAVNGLRAQCALQHTRTVCGPRPRRCHMPRKNSTPLLNPVMQKGNIPMA
jgi:hypothetical protein